MNTRKFAASAVALSMIVSMTGCSLLGGGKAKEEVISAADSFASNVCSLKASKITGAVADMDEDFADGIAIILDAVSSDDVLSAIAGTLTYEIDEDSVEVDSKKGEASVDVVFTYVDADSVYADVTEDGGDVDAFIDALSDSDEVVEVETTIEFVLENDEWLVDDSELECLEDVYAFFDAEYEFGSDFMEAYEGYSWWNADTEDTYADAYYIDFWATYDYSLITEEPEFYFEVEHDGTLIYTSDVSYSCDCYFYADDYSEAVNGYLPEGSYTITLYLADGTLVDSGSCYVYVSDAAAGTGSGAGTTTGIDTEIYWDDPDSEWANTISSWGWYDYNISNVGDGFYAYSDIVEFDLLTDDDSAGSLYYVYYYLSDGTYDSIDYDSPVDAGTINYTAYTNGNFYEFSFDYSDPGVYLIVIAESEAAWDNGDGDLLCHSMCVIE